MSDLISRDAAFEAIEQIQYALWEIDIPSPTVPEYVEHHESVQSVMKRIKEIRKALEDIPSASPERTGRWTHVYDENAKLFFRNKWICSACGKSNTYGMSDFCPCCGAMMENSTRRTKEAEN